MTRTPRHSESGFTLIELLVTITVIAVLGILAAILVPVVGRAQESARRARVKTQFAQWTVAIEGFRAEYGYYPNFATGTAAPLPAACRVNEVPGLFVQTLTGRRADGAAPDLARAVAADGAPVRDEAQVRLLSRALSRVDLAPLLMVPEVAREEGWILGAGHVAALEAAL